MIRTAARRKARHRSLLVIWLVVGQVVATNPAHADRGPKHVVKRGKTPVLTAGEAQQLLDSIDVSTIVGLRDRALIALMVFSFARVSAATAMRVEDYFATGKRWWVRLHEKAASFMRCQRITISKPISTPICRPPRFPNAKRTPPLPLSELALRNFIRAGDASR